MDLNSRLFAYLCGFYLVSPVGNDLTSLLTRRLAELSGEYTARLQQVIAAATA